MTAREKTLAFIRAKEDALAKKASPLVGFHSAYQYAQHRVKWMSPNGNWTRLRLELEYLLKKGKNRED